MARHPGRSSMSACPACGVEQPSGKKFCRACGASLAAATLTPAACPTCGNPAAPGAKFCPGCGSALAAPPAQVAAPPIPAPVPPLVAADTAPPARTAPVAAAPPPPRAAPEPGAIQYQDASVPAAASSGSGGAAWIVAVGVAALALFAAGGWYMFRAKAPAIT